MSHLDLDKVKEISNVGGLAERHIVSSSRRVVVGRACVKGDLLGKLIGQDLVQAVDDLKPQQHKHYVY